jgi:hypothetical protein
MDAMDDSLRGLRSSADVAVPLLEELEPLSPASMQIFDRPLRAANWSRVDMETRVEPQSSGTLEHKPLHDVTGAPATPQQPTEAVRAKPKSDPKANLRRNRHREREKRELMYLRACADMLGRQLEQLQQRQAAMTEDQRRGMFLQESRAMLWRSLALRRRIERDASEKENARLRGMWRAQMQFVEQVQQLAPVPRAPGPVNGHEARLIFGDFDADVLQTLLDDLDTMYEQSGRVLASLGLVSVPETCFTSIRSRDSAHPSDVDLLGMTLLRADYLLLRQMAWERVVARFLARGGVCVDTLPEHRGRTLAIKMRYQAPPNAAEVQADEEDNEGMYFEIVLALRQYIISPSREVLVWKSLNTGGGGLSGLIAHEMGYCVMHRSIEHSERTVLTRARRLEVQATRSETQAFKIKLLGELSLGVMEDDLDEALGEFWRGAGVPASE